MEKARQIRKGAQSAADRRQKRSSARLEALQYLAEAVSDRSQASTVAIVDDSGRLVAGVGLPVALRGLAEVARDAARGESTPALDRVTAGTDYFARRVECCGGSMVIAALGERMRRWPEAIRALSRIAQLETA